MISKKAFLGKGVFFVIGQVAAIFAVTEKRRDLAACGVARDNAPNHIIMTFGVGLPTINAERIAETSRKDEVTEKVYRLSEFLRL